jgi:hypothetical protein
MYHFSVATPAGPGQDDVATLLRQVAQTLDALGAVTVHDITFHVDVTDDGPWPSMSVYYEVETFVDEDAEYPASHDFGVATFEVFDEGDPIDREDHVHSEHVDLSAEEARARIAASADGVVDEGERSVVDAYDVDAHDVDAHDVEVRDVDDTIVTAAAWPAAGTLADVAHEPSEPAAHLDDHLPVNAGAALPPSIATFGVRRAQPITDRPALRRLKELWRANNRRHDDY